MPVTDIKHYHQDTINLMRHLFTHSKHVKNRFWERMGFRDRSFLRYKNKALVELEWYD